MSISAQAHSQISRRRSQGVPENEKRTFRVERSGPMSGLSNKGLHQTGREGVAHFVRSGPVVEARPAGEARCSAGL